MYKPTQLTDDYVLEKVDARQFEEAVIEFWKNFLQSYRDYVEQNYLDWYKEYPNSFTFMEPTHWVTVFHNRHIDFHVFENFSDYMTFGYHQFTTLGEMRAHDRLTEEQKREKLQKIIGKTEKSITTVRIKYGFILPAIISDPDYVSEDPNDFPEMGLISGRNYAQLHGDALIKEKKERFSLFGLEKYVTKVNDEHFEYEIAEAIMAYRAELYLAATAVTGVAMENLLSLIIVQNCGEDKLPKRKYIKDYIKVLVLENLIDNREARRFEQFSDTRNGAAHSNSGKIYCSDAEVGLNLINKLIIKFFT